MKRKMVLAAMSATLLVLGGLSSAFASEPASDTDEANVDICVDEAVDRSLEVWTCIGGTLSYYEEESSEPGVADAEVVSEQVAPTEIVETDDSGALTPMSTSDPDNYWCEQGDVCRSRKSTYVQRTKANVAWGNTQGVSGSFDLLIHSNLNGRSSRGQVKIFRDTGASLKFTNLQIVCDHDGNAFGCGSKYADKDDGAVSVTTSWIGPTVQGNRLNQKGTYSDKITGRVTPAGAPVLPLPALRGLKFDCPAGNGDCEFP